MTLTDEVGRRPHSFDDAPATPIIHKSQFNQTLGTDYYQVVGSTVYLVGRAEERSDTPTLSDGAVDFSKPRRKKTVILSLAPRVPVLRYDGKETTWTFGDVPYLKADGEDPDQDRRDRDPRHGQAWPLPYRASVGASRRSRSRTRCSSARARSDRRSSRRSVYGRGIGLIEATRRISAMGQKAQETRTKLVSIEEAKDGG